MSPVRTPRKASRRAAAKRAPRAAHAAANAKLEAFMKQAYAMELEAAERYAEFADQMDIANNREVAQLFRKLAGIEGKHAAQILEQMGWKQAPLGVQPFRWEGLEGVETGEHLEMHYLMKPFHALSIALRNEDRAARFFAHVARQDLPKAVREAAAEMAEEEREHVRWVKEWIARVPQPGADWDRDPDPPNVND